MTELTSEPTDGNCIFCDKSGQNTAHGPNLACQTRMVFTCLNGWGKQKAE